MSQLKIDASLIGRHLEIYLNANLCKYFLVLLYTFFILNCLLTRIFNHKCFYPMLLMSYWSKSHRASHRHVDATILKAFQQDIGTKITFLVIFSYLLTSFVFLSFFSRREKSPSFTKITREMNQ